MGSSIGANSDDPNGISVEIALRAYIILACIVTEKKAVIVIYVKNYRLFREICFSFMRLYFHLRFRLYFLHTCAGSLTIIIVWQLKNPTKYRNNSKYIKDAFQQKNKAVPFNTVP